MKRALGTHRSSFAYDGKRVRKWSVESSAYGQQWAKGDVIGCMIDLDAGEISYARNGVDMGVAFTGVKGFESGLAYFPALSLSHGEKCDVNFGDRPFLYPIDGFTPMQLPPPVADLKRGRYLADTLGRIMRASRVAAAARGQMHRRPRRAARWGSRTPYCSAGPSARGCCRSSLPATIWSLTPYSP